MMNTLTLLLVALSLPCCAGQSMESIPSTSVVKRPGETLSLSCRGSGFTFSCCSMHWIRQPAGKALEWIGRIYSDASGTDYASSVQGRIAVTRDNSNTMVNLRLSNLTPEDSAVYYCAGGANFDYWGRGTEVTVSNGNAESPTVFPLVQCTPGSADKVTVGCLAKDYYPKSLTFQWTDGSGNTQTSVQYPPVEKNNKYTGVSLLQVQKSAWDSKRSFNCSVTHSGGQKGVTLEKPPTPPPKVTLLAVPGGDDQTLVCTIQDLISNELSVKWKKGANDVTGSTTWDPQKTGSLYSAVSVLKVMNTDWDSDAVYTCEVMHQGTKHTKKVTKAPITMTLRRSSPKDMFINNQAKLECVVTGQNIDQIQITWEIDGQDVTGNNNKTTTSGSSKTSTITRSRTGWKGVNTVRCLALRDNMTPVIQDLTFNKGDGSEPNVTVHVLPEEDISSNPAKVTLVCLVSSRLKTDYYIAWSERIGQNDSSYTDGIDSLPQKNQDGYSVTSIYTTTKDEWDKDTTFSCNVWPATKDNSTRPRTVSKAQNNSINYFTPESDLHFALSCTDEAIEEEEYSSLWFTTSSFIFLFISSLLYNMIFSLVKMKKP